LTSAVELDITPPASPGDLESSSRSSVCAEADTDSETLFTDEKRPSNIPNPRSTNNL
uniref:Peroxisome proliferator activated receptor gamma n=1 Tax=Echinostoma caproni TaxID=27848 RepID=A0A183AAN0_9TREM